MQILEKLSHEKNKFMIFGFELFLSDHDEDEFLDTLRRILKKELSTSSSIAIQSDQKSDGQNHMITPSKITQNITSSSQKERPIGMETIHNMQVQPPRLSSSSRGDKNEDVSDFNYEKEESNFDILSIKTLPNSEPDQNQEFSHRQSSSNKPVFETPMFNNERKSWTEVDESGNKYIYVNKETSLEEVQEPEKNYLRVQTADDGTQKTGAFLPSNNNIETKEQPPTQERTSIEAPQAQEPPADQASKVIPSTSVKVDFTYSFCKRGTDREAFLKGTSQAQPLTKSNENEPSQNNNSNVQNNNSGIENDRNSSASNGSNPPAFGTAAAPVQSTPSQTETKEKDPQPPAVIEIPKATQIANWSFRNDGFRNLLAAKPQAPTIMEQKEEDLASPTKNSLKGQENLSLPIVESSPQKSTDSPVFISKDPNSNRDKADSASPKGGLSPTGEKNSAYLGQLSKFVLHQDGADNHLGKIFAEYVSNGETGSHFSVSSPSSHPQNLPFSEELFEYAKRKFIKTMMNYGMQPMLLEEAVQRGDLFKELFEKYEKQSISDSTQCSLDTFKEEFQAQVDKHDFRLHDKSRLKEALKKASIMDSKKPQEKKSSLLKLQKIQTMRPEELSEIESQGSKSRISKYTKLSRLSEREEKKKNEMELTEKIYAAMKNFNGKLKKDLDKLIEEAIKEGDEVDKFTERALEDSLNTDFSQLLDILFNYGYFYDYKRVQENFQELIKTLNSEGQSMMSPRGEHRRSHYLKFKALLRHMRDDTAEITRDMCDVFNDLLTRENWGLISAYELFIQDWNREDLIDTLFAIYRTFSDNSMIEDIEEEQEKAKQSMDVILFHFKTRFDQKIYEKLVDLIRQGDTKTKELHDTYKKDKDEKKFVKDLTEYAREKIKRKL